MNLLAFIWLIGCCAFVATVGILATTAPSSLWEAVVARIRHRCENHWAEPAHGLLRCSLAEGHEGPCINADAYLGTYRRAG